jgi:hypothetical protein
MAGDMNPQHNTFPLNDYLRGKIQNEKERKKERKAKQ